MYYGEDDEAYDDEEAYDEDDSKGAGMSLDDAVASFNETAGGFMDKTTKASTRVARPVDLIIVEIVEEDVYERPKRRGFEMPTFGSFAWVSIDGRGGGGGGGGGGGAAEGRQLGFGGDGTRERRRKRRRRRRRRIRFEGDLGEERGEIGSHAGGLDKDLEKGVAARSKVREGRAGQSRLRHHRRQGRGRFVDADGGVG